MQTGPADIVLRGGRVRTLDVDSSQHEAIAVKGNRILAVGRNDEMAACIGPSTACIDLDGATTIPGFNDSHAHMDREGLKSVRLSLAGARSIADIQERIAAAARKAGPGEWIVTMPVGEPPFYFDGPGYLAEGRMPDRYELDRVSPSNPVCISAVFCNWSQPPGYTALNSMALALNGIDNETEPMCSGVEILKDRLSGIPTGVIVEHNPRPTIDNDILGQVPRFTYDERRDALYDSMHKYNAAGTTSIYEGHGLGQRTIDAYREVWRAGDLTVRVGIVLSPASASFADAKAALSDWIEEARTRPDDDLMLKTCGLHVAFGGDPKTAELSRRSLPDTGWAGFVEQANDLADFRDYCFLCAEHDIRLHTIVADRLHEVVPVLREVASKYDLSRKRWVIEHIAHCRPEDLVALKELGMLVTTIPVYFLWKGGEKYFNAPYDTDHVVPHRRMREIGIHVAAATDNIPYDPSFTLWNMCSRIERKTNAVLGEDQRLSPEEALRLLTVNGAALTFDEHEKGPLLPGYLADIAVLENDPVTSTLEQIRDNKCRMTILDGRIVYQ